MDLAQAQIPAPAPREPKLLIEKVGVEVDTFWRSVERAPPVQFGGRHPTNGLVKTPPLQ